MWHHSTVCCVLAMAKSMEDHIHVPYTLLTIELHAPSCVKRENWSNRKTVYNKCTRWQKSVDVSIVKDKSVFSLFLPVRWRSNGYHCLENYILSYLISMLWVTLKVLFTSSMKCNQTFADHRLRSWSMKLETFPGTTENTFAIGKEIKRAPRFICVAARRNFFRRASITSTRLPPGLIKILICASLTVQWFYAIKFTLRSSNPIVHYLPLGVASIAATIR